MRVRMHAMKTRKPSPNPYRNASKARKAALAFLAARGITQPRATYPAARHVDDSRVKLIAQRRVLTLVS
jgi:hypothetical protein